MEGKKAKKMSNPFDRRHLAIWTFKLCSFCCMRLMMSGGIVNGCGRTRRRGRLTRRGFFGLAVPSPAAAWPERTFFFVIHVYEYGYDGCTVPSAALLLPISN